jgi:hypothetical protein
VLGFQFRFEKKWKQLKPGAYSAVVVRARINKAGNLELVLTDVREVKGESYK